LPRRGRPAPDLRRRVRHHLHPAAARPVMSRSRDCLATLVPGRMKEVIRSRSEEGRATKDVGRRAVAERIPDEALGVRGGRNQPEDLRRGMRTHSSGVTGVSVECAEGLSVEKLAVTIPHGQIGVTTVGAIRAAGCGVVRTSGRSPNHATVVRLSPEEASGLLGPPTPNPAKQP
jgi:hypothetical protein